MGNGTTTFSKVNVATREAVGQLERRFGHKRVVIGGAVAGAIVLLLLVRGVAPSGNKPQPPPPRNVQVAKVITHDVPLYLDEIGATAAYETVDVRPQVSGQVVAREFQDGAFVKKGDLLFRIDPRPYEATLQSAQAQLALD